MNLEPDINTYFCPTCDGRRMLLDPCAHVQITPEALQLLRERLPLLSSWSRKQQVRDITIENCELQAPSHAALGELAAMGSDVASLLAAVDAGATLVMTGPDPLGSTAAPRFAGSIESNGGAREAHATGAALLEMVAGLATAWRRA